MGAGEVRTGKSRCHEQQIFRVLARGVRADVAAMIDRFAVTLKSSAETS
jgi:hypothetical protein